MTIRGTREALNRVQGLLALARIQRRGGRDVDLLVAALREFTDRNEEVLDQWR